MDSIGRKHKWIKEFNIKTAKQLLQEQQETEIRYCAVRNCGTKIFHKGDYCLKHEKQVKQLQDEE